MPSPPSEVDPADLVPLSATKAGEPDSPVSLIIRGLGLDASLFVDNLQSASTWQQLEEKSLEELIDLYD